MAASFSMELCELSVKQAGAMSMGSYHLTMLGIVLDIIGAFGFSC
jgi:hypothetical protein